MARISPKDYNTYEEYLEAGGKDDPTVKAMFGAKKNVAKASAATDAPLASKKDVSMASEDKAVQPVIKAEKKVNEAKLKDARKPENQVAVNSAENEMIEADKNADTAVTENLEQDINSKIDTIASKAGIAIPEEAKNTQEITFAMDALQNGDFVDLSKITLPTGEGLFQVNFDKNGNAYPPERAEIPKPALESRGAAAFFTVMSVLLSAFTGGLVPPINFGKLLGTDEYWDRVYEQNKNVADLMNKGTEQNLMNEVQNKQTQERINMAKANEDKLNAYGRMQEAEAGGTGYQQAVLNADLQKAIKGMDIENSQTLARMTNEQQKEMARLLFDQETSRPVAEYIKMMDAKVDPDTLAKYKRAYQGITKLDKAFQYLDGIVGAAAQGVTAGATAGLLGKKAAESAAGAISGGKSDKDVKTFNTNMLRKAWGKR